MEEIVFTQEHLLKNLSSKERYLSERIDWSDRLIGIKGARGTGKTTLLLQQVKKLLSRKKQVLFVSMDNLYFLENNLVSLAKEFSLNGGTHLFLDEVHKYPRWSRELKLVYDQFPNLKFIFTSSSILEIYKGESDLSRRAVTYHLKELSFREFIYFEKGILTPKIDIEELLTDHREIASEIRTKIPTPVKEFKEYLKIGAYPFFLESKKSYPIKLMKTLNLILEIDLNVLRNITYSDSLKIKKLLVAVAQSVPFIPNVSKLSERLQISRGFLLDSLKLLNQADLIIELFKPTKGIGALTKPQKLFLNNTNLIHILSENNLQPGTIRETFFVNQMKHLHKIHLAEKGDFLIDRKYTFEIGGKGKNTHQIQGVPNAFVVRDDMEIGGMNIIPLWLFGFLY